MMETDDILNRIFDKLDKVDLKIDDLCERATKTETKLDDYLTAKDKEINIKDRNYKIGFGFMGVIFGLYALIKEYVHV